MTAINPYITNGELQPAQARAKFCHLKANFNRSPIAEGLSNWVEDNYPNEPVYKVKYLLLMAKAILADSPANCYTWQTIDEQRAFCRACEFIGNDGKFALAAIEKAIELGFFVAELYNGKMHLFCPEVQEDLREFHYKIVRQKRIAAEQKRNAEGKFLPKNAQNTPETLTILDENEENIVRYNGGIDAVTTAPNSRYNGTTNLDNSGKNSEDWQGENRATDYKNTEYRGGFTVTTVPDEPLQRVSGAVEKKRKEKNREETNYYCLKINNNKKNTKICKTDYFFQIYSDTDYFLKTKEKLGIEADDKLALQILVFDHYITEKADSHDCEKTLSSFTEYVKRFMAWHRTNSKKDLLNSMEISLLHKFSLEELSFFYSGIAEKFNTLMQQTIILNISVIENKNKFLKITICEEFANLYTPEAVRKIFTQYFSLFELRLTKLQTKKIPQPQEGQTKLSDSEQAANVQKLNQKLNQIFKKQ